MSVKERILETLNNAKYLLEFNRLTRKFKGLKWAVAILAALQTTALLFLPLLGGRLLDDALIPRSREGLLLIGAGGALATALSILLGFPQSFLAMRLRLKAGMRIKKKVASRIEHLPLEAFLNRDSGDFLFRISNQLDFLCTLSVTWPEQLLTITCQLAIATGMFLFLSWQLFLVLLVAIAIDAAMIFLLSRRKRKLELESVTLNVRSFRYLGELLSRIGLVKAIREEHYAFHEYMRGLTNQARLLLKRWRVDTINNMAGNGLSLAIFGVITAAGSYQVVHGHMTAGQMAAFMAYVSTLRSSKNRIYALCWSLFLGATYAKQLNEALGSPDSGLNMTGSRVGMLTRESERQMAAPGKPAHTGIEVRGISFGYTEDKLVFSDASLTIPPMGITAVVGPSGSGKTTLLRLMLGLHKVQRGHICIGNADLTSLSSDWIRQNIAIVTQQPLVWNDTIENNLRFGKPVLSFGKISAAARITGLDSIIADLPKGLSTVIGENACRLSEGQKQRVMITRAILREPRILIMDEAMSSLDAASEQHILSELRKLEIETIVIISHRLSTIQSCDHIRLVNCCGQAAEGSLGSLLDREQAFKTLFSPQFLQRGPE